MRILILSTLLLAGCQTTNCYKSVALTNLTIAEAAKSITASARAKLISVGDNENAAVIIQKAAALTDEASPLCTIDKNEAFKLLTRADKLLEMD